MNQQSQELLLDLLIKKAVYGLTEEEQKQLGGLEAATADKEDLSFEMTAAAINLTAADAGEKLPAHIRARIEDAADDYFAGREIGAQAAQLPSQAALRPKAGFWNWLGWAVAAASVIILAVNIYTTRLQPREAAKNPPIQTPTPVLTLAQQREELLASASDVVTASWTDFDPKKPQNVRGDVVWSNSLQKGFLRFQGLPVNDKSREAYQLWIFDAGQNPKTPVDGGVFDAESGDFIVPIDAKLKIEKPTMFAVTAEKPGGVVISTLGKVMAVAKV